ncbi:MAG: hypothetical protein ACI3ZJ_02915 [Bacteroidaceae bacterium]
MQKNIETTPFDDAKLQKNIETTPSNPKKVGERWKLSQILPTFTA